MKHKMSYDDEIAVLHLDIIGAFSRDDALEILPRIKKYSEGKEHFSMLADISQSPSLTMDRQTRRMLQKEGMSIEFDKMAFVGASPFTRIICKVIMAVLGKSKEIQFCSTCEEGFAWIQKPIHKDK
jgi:hypothetical protein